MKLSKRIFFWLLSAALICSAAGVTALASDTQVVAATSLPGAEPAYFVTVPSSIDLGALTRTETTSIKSKTFVVKAEGMTNMYAKQVNVSVSAQDDVFQLMKDNVSLPYQLFQVETGGTALASGGLFTSFTTNGSVTGRVSVDQKDIAATGRYTGYVTFHITLTDRP